MKEKKSATPIPLDIERLKITAKKSLNEGRTPTLRARHKLWVLERDNFKCQKCGSCDNLTIDHIRTSWKHGKRTYSSSNIKLEDCQVLCVECHTKKNTYGDI